MTDDVFCRHKTFLALITENTFLTGHTDNTPPTLPQYSQSTATTLTHENESGILNPKEIKTRQPISNLAT